jgi:hypothetical protein
MYTLVKARSSYNMLTYDVPMRDTTVQSSWYGISIPDIVDAHTPYSSRRTVKIIFFSSLAARESIIPGIL